MTASTIEVSVTGKLWMSKYERTLTQFHAVLSMCVTVRTWTRLFWNQQWETFGECSLFLHCFPTNSACAWQWKRQQIGRKQTRTGWGRGGGGWRLKAGSRVCQSLVSQAAAGFFRVFPALALFPLCAQVWRWFCEKKACNGHGDRVSTPLKEAGNTTALSLSYKGWGEWK